MSSYIPAALQVGWIFFLENDQRACPFISEEGVQAVPILLVLSIFHVLSDKKDVILKNLDIRFTIMFHEKISTVQYRQVLLRKLGGVKKIIYEAKTRKSSCHKTRTESLAKELSSLLVTKNGLRSCVSLLYDPCQRRCHNCVPRLSIHSQWGENIF